MNQIYLDTARLLTQVAPLVFVDHRLERDDALARINAAIRGAADRLTKRGFQTHVATVADAGETKLFVRRGKLEVKAEVNFVLRGTLHPVRTASLAPKAKAALLADMELPVLSLEDLYGGKLVAALDRQHPRDLFDAMQLFCHEGITPGIRRSFVAYLACHNRPMHEVISPTLRDIAGDFDNTFRGMTVEPVTLADLLSARERLVAELRAGLDADEREFLLALARNEPNWELLGIGHLAQLPGMRWKLANLERLARANPKKLKSQARALESLFAGSGRA